MRASRGFTAAFGVVVLSLGLLAADGAAQRQVPERQHMPEAHPEMTRGAMMSMDEMVHRMRDLMGRMSGMMSESRGMMQGRKEGRGMMGGPGMMGGRDTMMGMTRSMDDLATSMDEVLQQMRAMMADHAKMRAPRIATGMQDLQRHMSAMMEGFDGMVRNLHEMRGYAPGHR